MRKRPAASVIAKIWPAAAMVNCLACEATFADGQRHQQAATDNRHCTCGSPRSDKGYFTLFNPTPRRLMREMSTDRPDTTESPYTLDAGHFQLELSVAEYSRDDDSGASTETLDVLPINVKLGLLNSVDIQFLFTPYVREESGTGAREDIADGFGDDTRVRLKINLWGNDGAASGVAFGIMPFVKLPTGSDDLSNGHTEGGIILPLSVALPRGFDLGLMVEADFVYSEEADDYGVEVVHSAVLGHPIVGDLAAYLEYVGIAPHGSGDTYQAIGSAGFTFMSSDNWMIDFGGTASPSDSAEDFSVFVGTSFRL